MFRTQLKRTPWFRRAQVNRRKPLSPSRAGLRWQLIAQVELHDLIARYGAGIGDLTHGRGLGSGDRSGVTRQSL